MNPQAFNSLLEIGPGDSFHGSRNSPHSRSRMNQGDIETGLGGNTGIRKGGLAPFSVEEVARLLRKVNRDDPDWIFGIAERLGIDPDDEDSFQELERMIDEIDGQMSDQ